MSLDTGAVQGGKGTDGDRKQRLLSLRDLDGRTRAKQRAEDLRGRIIAERGGCERMDAMRLAYIDSWAWLTALIEHQMAKVILGEAVNPADVATLINARRREGEAIGGPTPRDVTPDLEKYLAIKRAPMGAGEDRGSWNGPCQVDREKPLSGRSGEEGS